MSTRHADILDQQDSLRGPFFRSLLFHGALFGSLAVYGWWNGRGRETFGDPNASGGAIGVEVVNKIPLAARSGVRNPVANDTESQVPTPEPKPVEKQRVPEPEPGAIPLRNSKVPKPRPEAVARKFQPEIRPNQMTSTVGQAVQSPVFAQAPGNGGVGTGPASSLGTRFGAYEALIRQIIASKWRTTDVDASIHTAPPATVTFEIGRDGGIRNVRLLQGSGISVLDFSAQRAILEANPLPPLPPGFERDTARVELLFQLKR